MDNRTFLKTVFNYSDEDLRTDIPDNKVVGDPYVCESYKTSPFKPGDLIPNWIKNALNRNKVLEYDLEDANEEDKPAILIKLEELKPVIKNIKDLGY